MEEQEREDWILLDRGEERRNGERGKCARAEGREEGRGREREGVGRRDCKGERVRCLMCLKLLYLQRKRRHYIATIGDNYNSRHHYSNVKVTV